MASSMNQQASERFLEELHVGVLSVVDRREQAGTLAVPIWYSFDPAVGVSVITSTQSRKGRALDDTGRFSLTVQQEALPYKYVSVEGPVVEVRRAELERDVEPMAIRYLGPEAGSLYARQWHAAGGNDSVFVMRPQRWLAVDLTDELAALAPS